MNAEPLRGLAYLGTPFTRYRAGQERAFIDASMLAARLTIAGIKVFCPIAHAFPLSIYGNLDALDPAMWLPLQEAIMEASRCLIVGRLDGWDESDGLAYEIKVFEQARKPIWDCDPASLSMIKRQYEVAFS